MRRLIFLAAITTSLPVTAQMNPAAIGGGLVMPAAINAQAKNLSGSRSQRGRNPETAAGCANVPEFKREFGANHPKVRKLIRLCRNLGYSTGE